MGLLVLSGDASTKKCWLGLRESDAGRHGHISVRVKGAELWILSHHDINHDGRLAGYERVRYEDNNVAYPGSLVPDLINEQYECRHRGLLDDDESSSTAFGYGKDSGDNFVDDSDDDSASSYDDFDFCYEPETCVLDDPDDFGPEDQYWFHPKTTDDLLRALDAPKYLGGCRLYAHRCYNCRRWNEMVPTVNTKDDGCGIYYDRDIDRDLDNCSPDEDGEVCKRFKFRHKTHG